MVYRIMTECDKQRANWIDTLSTDVLPVVYPYPLEVWGDHGKTAVFPLDVTRLSRLQLWQLAERETPRFGDRLATMQDIERNGRLIDATYCRLV